MPVTMTSGTAGRVRNALNSFTIATVKLWRLGGDTVPHPVLNFDSYVDSDRRLWPNVYAGTSSGKIYLEGFFNSHSTDTTDGSFADLTNGVFVGLDLHINKDVPWGYANVLGLVTNFTPTVNVENQAAGFTCEIMVRQGIPRSGVIT